MGRPPVFIPRGSLVEFTARTRKGRRLFRPNRELNERVYGVIGRALSQFDVRLNSFVYLSNHQHSMALVADAKEACGFIGYVNRNTALAAQRVTGWDDDVWAHSSIVPILDDEAAIARLRYILSNGVKEGLVESPLEWPGATSARALIDGTQIEARWRPAGQKDPDPSDPVFPIALEPLPAWKGHSAEQRRRSVAELVRGIEEEGRALRDGRAVLGANALRAQNPFEETELSGPDRSAPLAHSSRPDLLQRFKEERAAFIDQFRATSRAHAQSATHNVPRTVRVLRAAGRPRSG